MAFEHLHDPNLLQRLMSTDEDMAGFVDDTGPVKRRKRRPTFATIIRQADKAGLTVTAIRPDGTIVVGKPGASPEDDEWDGVVLQ